MQAGVRWFLSVIEVADFLGVSVLRVRFLIATQQLLGVRRDGMWLVSVGELLAYLEAQNDGE